MEVSNIFSQFATACKSKLLSATTLTDGLLEQIKPVLDEADLHYTSYYLANNWNAPGRSAHYRERAAKPHIKCGNYGKNHYVSTCSKRRDENHTKASVEARCAKSRQVGGSGKKRGDGGGITCGRHYKRLTFGQGKWKPPIQGEMAHKIDRKIYYTCKTCGWTIDSKAHSSGKDEENMRNSDSFSLAVTHPHSVEMAKLGQMPTQDSNTQAITGDEKKLGISMGLAALATKASAIEKYTDSDNTLAFAGQFAVMLTALSTMALKE